MAKNNFGNILKSGTTVGAYHFIIPSITIEAAERISGRDYPTIFEHENTHKFLVELSETGFILRMLYRYLGSDAETNPVVNKIFENFWFVQECFATNNEILYARLNNLDWKRIISSYPDIYKEAYNSLAKFHDLLFRYGKNGQILLMLLGSYTFGYPLLNSIEGSDIENNENWIKTIENHDALPENRFEDAKASLSNSCQNGDSFQDLYDKCKLNFRLPWRIVDKNTVQQYASTLRPNSTYQKMVFEHSSAYNDKQLEIVDLYPKVKFHAFLQTSCHFTLKLDGNLIEEEELLLISKSHPNIYYHVIYNNSQEPLIHGLTVYPDECLLMFETYEKSIIYGEWESVYEPESIGTGFAKTNLNNCLEVINVLRSRVDSIEIGQWRSFDSAKNQYLFQKTDIKNPMLLTMPYLSLNAIFQLIEEIKVNECEYLLHVIYENDEGSSYFCIRPKIDYSWIFISPIISSTSQYISDILENNHYTNINYCEEKEEFITNMFIEKKLVMFILHCSKYGW